MIDKGLETKIAKAFNELGTTRELKEVRISTDKWEIIRNSNSGVIIGRRLKAYIIATSKEKCCYEEIGFVQDYDGAAYAENFYAYGYSGVYYIPCGCIPK